MDFLNSQFAALYSTGLLLFVWMILYWRARTRRNRQWLLLSAICGGAILPLMGMLLAPEEMDAYTVLPGNWSIIEAAILSGLLWSITASSLMVIRLINVTQLPLKISWIRIGAFYLLLWASTVVADFWSLPALAALVGSIGLTSILLTIWDNRLLLMSLATGIITSIITLGLSIAFTNLSPAITKYDLPWLPVDSTLPLTAVAFVAIMAMSAPIITRWWFQQPLKKRST